ncbi:MAG: right-handed parallel beta-helix repeat-containing protein [Archangium sp.]
MAAVVCGCATPQKVITEPVADAPRPAVWVDSFAAPGGDGSSERPWKNVPSSLPPRAVLHLRSGVYTGPFVFEAVRVEGHGEVVLTAEAGQTTVTATRTELTSLSIQGGEVGLAVPAGAAVKGTTLHFSGQRKLASRVEAGGTLSLEKSELIASVEGVDGVSISGHLVARELKLEGGFRRGVWCERGSFEVRGLSARGVKAPVHASDCAGSLGSLDVEAGAGAAVFSAGSTLEVKGLVVRGSEFGLQLTRHSKVRAAGLDVARTQVDCVSALQSELTLSDSQLTACGNGGAVLLQDSTAWLSGLDVHDTPDLGVLARQSTLDVKDSKFTRITSGNGQALGDAIHARQSKTVLVGVRVSDVEGSGLFATAFAEVEVKSLEVERARQSAVFVERRSVVKVDSLLVRGGGGGAILVPDQARVSVRSLSVAGGTELPIYAECNEGAEVEVGRIESTVQQLKSRCITPLSP